MAERLFTGIDFALLMKIIKSFETRNQMSK